MLSTTSAGGSLRTWIQVSGPGTITQVGTSAAIEPRVCRAALTVRKAGRVLVVCTPGRRARTLLPCRPVKVRLSTVFRTPDRVKRTTVREVRLDACLRVAAVTG
jgi:ribosomal protein L36